MYLHYEATCVVRIRHTIPRCHRAGLLLLLNSCGHICFPHTERPHRRAPFAPHGTNLPCSPLRWVWKPSPVPSLTPPGTVRRSDDQKQESTTGLNHRNVIGNIVRPGNKKRQSIVVRKFDFTRNSTHLSTKAGAFHIAIKFLLNHRTRRGTLITMCEQKKNYISVQSRQTQWGRDLLSAPSSEIWEGKAPK